MVWGPVMMGVSGGLRVIRVLTGLRSQPMSGLRVSGGGRFEAVAVASALVGGSPPQAP